MPETCFRADQATLKLGIHQDGEQSITDQGDRLTRSSQARSQQECSVASINSRYESMNYRAYDNPLDLKNATTIRRKDIQD